MVVTFRVIVASFATNTRPEKELADSLAARARFELAVVNWLTQYIWPLLLSEPGKAEPPMLRSRLVQPSNLHFLDKLP